MNKELQTIYVPVKVEDELPDKHGRYLCIRNDDDFSYSTGYFNGKRFEDAEFEPKVIIWLRPLSAIVLSKEEWDDIIDALDSCAGEVTNHESGHYEQYQDAYNKAMKILSQL